MGGWVGGWVDRKVEENETIPIHTVAHSNRLLFLHPPTHPPTHLGEGGVGGWVGGFLPVRAVSL